MGSATSSNRIRCLYITKVSFDFVRHVIHSILIFVLVLVSLKVVMAKQNYRCAGCGMRVEPEHSHNFRYCHYLGRYFCTACHSNKSFVVPSRIFKKWDFRKYFLSFEIPFKLDQAKLFVLGIQYQIFPMICWNECGLILFFVWVISIRCCIVAADN